MRGTARRLVLVAAAVAAVAVAALSVWVDAERMVRAPLDVIEAATAPAAERAARWLGDSVGPVRDASANGGATVSGRARVIDGDTLEVGGARIRLHGIDAPESAQRCRAGGRAWRCGSEATRALERRIGSRTVACAARDRDRYGRTVAVCRVGGADVNAWMVAEGWAFAYRKYSTEYVAEETAAKAAKRGVWRGDVVAPWDWRRSRK